MDFHLNDQVIVDSPPSAYYGLVGKIVELLDWGASLTFSQEQCTGAWDPKRVQADRPIPFAFNCFKRPGEPRRPQDEWSLKLMGMIRNPVSIPAPPAPPKKKTPPPEPPPKTGGQVSLWD